MSHPSRLASWGSIEVICGSMFSGKTEELLRRIRRALIAKQKTQLFKPRVDNRYSPDHIQSHNADRLLSQPVEKSRDLLKHLEDHTRIVGIDEAQFFDEGIIDVAQKLAYRGLQVIVAGLDMDARGIPFGPMPKLLAVADEITKLSAVCVVCGNRASRTQRIAGSPTLGKVALGANEMYEARCRFCHDPDLLERESLPQRAGGIQPPPGIPSDSLASLRPTKARQGN